MTVQGGFWAGKKVFVTGHTGFKGAWLCLWLHRLGAQVCGYALAPVTSPNLFTEARVAELLAVDMTADVRDAAAIADALRQENPDVIFHLAAQSLVRESYEQPIETFDTNVMGTANVLQAARDAPGVRAVVIVTSDKCYDNRDVIWAYRETDAMGGRDPYSASKGCAELVTAAMARSFFDPSRSRCSVASARAGNVIGGGDWAKDRLMPDLMRGLLAGEPIVIRNPRAVRPWQHVLEPLSGYLTLAEHLWTAGPLAWEGWNFGPDLRGERTVQEVAASACSAWGRDDLLSIVEDDAQPHEAGLLKLDSTKARTCLGWRPTWSFEAGVARTVEWYRSFGARADMRQVTLGQIAAYEREAISAPTA